MREFEFEQTARGQAIAGTRPSAMRAGVARRRYSQKSPGGRIIAVPPRAERPAPPERLGRTLKCASMIPKALSQASNSGAGRKPSTDAHIKRIVVGGRLIAEHDVVGARERP